MAISDQDNLTLDDARMILEGWRGKSVHVLVKETNQVLAVLKGPLSEARDAMLDWLAYAVGDPSGDTAITIHVPSFREGRVIEGTLILRVGDGFVDFALDRSTEANDSEGES